MHNNAIPFCFKLWGLKQLYCCSSWTDKQYEMLFQAPTLIIKTCADLILCCTPSLTNCSCSVWCSDLLVVMLSLWAKDVEKHIFGWKYVKNKCLSFLAHWAVASSTLLRVLNTRVLWFDQLHCSTGKTFPYHLSKSLFLNPPLSLCYYLCNILCVYVSNSCCITDCLARLFKCFLHVIWSRRKICRYADKREGERAVQLWSCLSFCYLPTAS